MYKDNLAQEVFTKVTTNGESLVAIEPKPESEHAEGSTGSEPDQAVAVEPEPDQAPSDIPPAPAVRTVTLADLYWSQGEHSTAKRIVEEILRDEPANSRAQAWLAARTGGDLVEADLLEFLETMAKEYGYDLS